MPNRIAPVKVSHTAPFRTRDLEGLMAEVDTMDDISLSEEVIEGETQVRLWAERGVWPEGVSLDNLIARHLPVDEVAVIINTHVRSAASTELELIAVDSDGETTHSNLDDVINDMRDTARSFNMRPSGKASLGEPDDLDAQDEADLRAAELREDD
jgi:hypothetical protein